MSFLDRLFGKKQAAQGAADAGAMPARQSAGQPTAQTAEEQAATRGRMEAELNAQREKRSGASDPQA